MLHEDQIELLPALPDAWQEGRVKGLKARGGYEVDLAWKSGKLFSITLRSALGGACSVRYGGKTLRLLTRAGESYELAQRLLKS